MTLSGPPSGGGNSSMRRIDVEADGRGDCAYVKVDILDRVLLWLQ